MAGVNWVPIDAADLRIGHYVRIGHRWLDHPFIQRSFAITSAKEIAIIRESRLTQLFVDPVRSMPVPELGGADADDAGGEADSFAADAARLQSEKAAHAETVRRQRQELTAAQQRYGVAAERAESLLLAVTNGDSAASSHVQDIIQPLLADLGGSEASPLAFADAARPYTAQRRAACLALDAATIAGLVGRRLGLDDDGLNTLATAALLHTAGLAQLPESLRDERRVPPDDVLTFQDYPLLGVDQLRSCGGFAPDVLRIVRQHREYQDGSGFPEGASARDIHAHAPIVGAIREFQLLTADAGLTPAVALAQLYRGKRTAYGAWAVDNLIAALTVYPPGTFVTLSDGTIGRVMRVSTEARLRPLVCLFDEQVAPDEAEILDLSTVSGVGVASVLSPATLAKPVLEFFGNSFGGFAVAGPADAGVASIAA